MNISEERSHGYGEYKVLRQHLNSSPAVMQSSGSEIHATSDTKRQQRVAGAKEENTRSWSVLRYGLGILWLGDALLQMQPGMFHPAFYGKLPNNVMPSVLQIVQEGTVGWMIPAVGLTQSIFVHAPIATNLLIIVVQFVLAALLLLPVPRRFVRLGALLSICWGLSVWVFGEGIGGLFSFGDMNFYEGFPGSALLYAVAGFVLYLPIQYWRKGVSERIVQWSLAGLFTLSALLQILPIDEGWTVKGQLDVFANSGFQPQPAFFSSPIMNLTAFISRNPVLFNVILTVMLLGASLVVFRWTNRRSFLRVIVYLWLLWTWWFGQDFGFLFSGLSTDPNTAAIIFVLLFSMVKPRESDMQRRAKS